MQTNKSSFHPRPTPISPVRDPLSRGETDPSLFVTLPLLAATVIFLVVSWKKKGWVGDLLLLQLVESQKEGERENESTLSFVVWTVAVQSEAQAERGQRCKDGGGE